MKSVRDRTCQAEGRAHARALPHEQRVEYLRPLGKAGDGDKERVYKKSVYVF